MREFKSEEIFHIVGRGTVVTVTPTEAFPIDEIINHLIKIDETTYYCRAVERPISCHGNPVKVGEKIGLLIVAVTHPD